MRTLRLDRRSATREEHTVCRSNHKYDNLVEQDLEVFAPLNGVTMNTCNRVQARTGKDGTPIQVQVQRVKLHIIFNILVRGPFSDVCKFRIFLMFIVC